jgi:hypothetical protein
MTLTDTTAVADKPAAAAAAADNKTVQQKQKDDQKKEVKMFNFVYFLNLNNKKLINKITLNYSLNFKILKNK